MDYDADLKLNPYTAWFASLIMVNLFLEEPENKRNCQKRENWRRRGWRSNELNSSNVWTLGNDTRIQGSKIAMGYLML